MKKMYVILVAILVLLIGALLFLMSNKNDDKIVSTLTIDINPSMEINLNRNEKLVSINPLNDDARDVVSNDLNGKSLDDALKVITENVVEKGFVKEDKVVLLINTTGEIGSDKVKNILDQSFEEKKIQTEVVVVEKITEEDKEMASKYNISPAKAAYINQIKEENNNISVETLVEKPVNELKEVKETGKYCDEGYTLVGDSCEKKIKEEKPEVGYTCPDGYEEINSKCYKTKGTEQEYYCQSGQTLENNKCTGEVTTNAKAKCDKGEYNSKTGKCEVLTLVGDATKKCSGSDDYLLDNGKCARPHMGAHFDDPEGTIDPATECCCGDFWVANSSAPGRGWCYSPAGNYDATVSCKSGQTEKDGKCYTAESSDPTYYCEGNGKLNGTKCTETKTVNASTKKACSSDYKLYQDRICVNYNETTARIEGYTCEKEARLEDNHCVYYEKVKAKTN